VAKASVATLTPLGKARISGSLPTLPSRITLLTLFAITPLCLLSAGIIAQVEKNRDGNLLPGIPLHLFGALSVHWAIKGLGLLHLCGAL
jgi:hypothetical protein